MSYSSLHVHDEFSNISTGLDSINKLSNLIKYAEEINLNALAITNHDNLSEIWRINKAQKELKKHDSKLKLIYGNEIYLLPEWDPSDTTPRKYWHFILLAKDKIGFDALLELSSRAWYRSKFVRNKRRIVTLFSDIEEIQDKIGKGHLIAASACLGGLAPDLFLHGKEDEGFQFLEWCETQFGWNDFYIELQSSDIKDQTKWNTIIAEKLANKYQTIITTDAHCTRKEDFEMLEAFLRSSNENREVREYYEAAYIQTEDEIRSYLSYLPEEIVTSSLNNTNKIAEQIEFFDLAQKFHIPKVDVPELIWSGPSVSEYPVISKILQSGVIQSTYCLITCLNKLLEKDLWNKEYLDRLEEEFEVFKWQGDQLDDNFFAYFNNLQYYLNIAWEVDCAIGPSRGSASGSLLCYLMDIVQCDPIEYGLYFWRFASKVRASILDVDLDSDPVYKPAWIERIRQERGELGITQVCTFKTLTLKAAIGNACRGYRSKDFPNGIDADISTYLSSLIEVRRGFVAKLDQTLNGDETTGFSINHSWIKEVQKYPGLIEMINQFEGLITNSSTHAAAVVFFDIENDPITNHCSLMRSPNGDLCSGVDLHDIEELGVLKYDYLVLSTLSIMTATFKLLQKDNIIDPALSLKECYRKYIDPNKIDFNNPVIWDKIYNNEVLSIFQWDAASARKGILAAKPQNLFELTSLNGLIRLMTEDGEEDQIQRFVKIKEDPQLFEDEMREAGLTVEQRQIMHEELDKYNGCAATQESFMVLSQRLAGYTLADADKLRKTVAKKKMDEITQQKEFWDSKCPGNKEYLWKICIAPSLGYAFSLK